MAVRRERTCVPEALKRASVTGEVQQVSEVQAVPGKGESEAPRVQILGRLAFEGWCKCRAWIGE